MVYDYYKLMGWDLKMGKPYRRTLTDLGLEDSRRPVGLIVKDM
jgi:aldehyde:ferredoxin oxidoreductase